MDDELRKLAQKPSVTAGGRPWRLLPRGAPAQRGGRRQATSRRTATGICPPCLRRDEQFCAFSHWRMTTVLAHELGENILRNIPLSPALTQNVRARQHHQLHQVWCLQHLRNQLHRTECGHVSASACAARLHAEAHSTGPPLQTSG